MAGTPGAFAVQVPGAWLLIAPPGLELITLPSDLTTRWIDQMDLSAKKACDRVIGLAIPRCVFGDEALNPIPRVRAAVDEGRHVGNKHRHAEGGLI